MVQHTHPPPFPGLACCLVLSPSLAPSLSKCDAHTCHQHHLWLLLFTLSLLFSATSPPSQTLAIPCGPACSPINTINTPSTSSTRPYMRTLNTLNPPSPSRTQGPQRSLQHAFKWLALAIFQHDGPPSSCPGECYGIPKKTCTVKTTKLHNSIGCVPP